MRFGVDEAGKGPVLGSMFAAAVLADPADLPGGVADSKQLTPERRETLAAALTAAPDVHISVSEIPVRRIDDPETDMNTLTVEAHATALDALASDGLEGTLDAGDTDAARFGRRVAERVGADVRIHAAHRADETDSLVAAASIVAKVHRDAHVADLQAAYDEPLGSGYPSDPTTRSFLADFVGTTGSLPACARASWKTSRDVLAMAEQSDLEDF